jgi:hypothetical protein
MSKFNLFIDAGNDKMAEDMNNLQAHIALVKNMVEHVESVFVFANEENKLHKYVTKTPSEGSQVEPAVEEYSKDMVLPNQSLGQKDNKIIIVNKNNTDLLGKLSTNDSLKSIHDGALHIQVSDTAGLDLILRLFTETHPSKSDVEPLNIQLYANNDDESLVAKLNHIVRDARSTRGLLINFMTQAGGFLSFIKGKKSWHALAEDIVKRVKNGDKKFTEEDGSVNEYLINTYIREYYNVENLAKKATVDMNGVARTTDKKKAKAYYDAKNNYDSAYKAVRSMLKEVSKIKGLKASSVKKEIAKITGKTSQEFKAAVSAKVKHMGKQVIPGYDKPIQKIEKTADKADIIICDIKDKAKFESKTVPVIYYSPETIDILDKLLTAQFHESKRLHDYFYFGKGTKKSGVVSKVGKIVSGLTRKNIQKERSARREALSSFTKKAKSRVISTKKESVKAEKLLSAKRKELKKLGLGLFQRTKKKNLQAEIEKLESQIKKKKKNNTTTVPF